METHVSSFQMKPIGTMTSIFQYKNGTPRQPSLCQAARGILTIEKSIFNNPEHSLQGLEEYSHAWVIFVFHKNNNTCTKAKVKPPRLNGQRVGVFSTRSPYRPNNIGLSLVKIERIDGSSIHFSGVDLLDGTPVLDIKPYIPNYDCPRYPNQFSEINEKQSSSQFLHKSHELSVHNDKDIASLAFLTGDYGREQEENKSVTDPFRNVLVNDSQNQLTSHSALENLVSLSEALKNVGQRLDGGQSIKAFVDPGERTSKTDMDLDLELGLENEKTNVFPDNQSHSSNADDSSPNSRESSIKNILTSESGLTADLLNHIDVSGQQIFHHQETNTPFVAPWITKTPVTNLEVTLTSRALEQLYKFSKVSHNPHYRLQMLKDASEALKSIIEVLREEPRSVYRRQNCQDRLYYFTLDVLHVTCWFDDDNLAEVVRVKPMTLVPKLSQDVCKS